MVHFVGGPSVGGYKSYINHTYAREGQWRMPRNYGRPNVKISVKNYNTCCHHSSYGGGFQLPAWLQWAQFGLNFLQNLFPQKQEAPAAQPEVNPFEAKIKELDEKIKELEKENKELKNKPAGGPEKATETDPADVKDDFKVEDKIEEETVTTTTPETIEEKTIQVNNKSKHISGNTYEGYTWTSLQNAYVAEDGTTAPNTKAFRDAFRQQVLGGATDIGVGEQHYPKTFEFGGKTYTFKPDQYKPTRYDVSNEYTGTSAHTNKQVDKKGGETTTSTTYKGKATATWTDKDGKPHTETVNIKDAKDKKTAQTQLAAAIKAKVPAEFHNKIKIGIAEQK